MFNNHNVPPPPLEDCTRASSLANQSNTRIVPSSSATRTRLAKCFQNPTATPREDKEYAIGTTPTSSVYCHIINVLSSPTVAMTKSSFVGGWETRVAAFGWMILSTSLMNDR